MKLKEVVRLGGLCTVLTKEKGFSLQGRINYGKVTRKYMGKIKEDKVILVGSIYVLNPFSGVKCYTSLLGVGDGRGTFTKGNLSSVICQIKGEKRTLAKTMILSSFQFKMIFMPTCHIFE